MRRWCALLSISILLSACRHEPPGGAPPSTASGSANVPVGSAPNVPVGSASSVPVSGEEIRYLALGDSFTIGTGSPQEASFPSRLTERLKEKGAKVTARNLGVNGYRTEELLAREAPEIGRFQPTLVTLAIGANDLVNGSSLEHYREQVRLILKAIGDAGVAPKAVFVLPQPDWSRSVVADSFGDRQKIAAAIRSYNDALREEAASWGAVWVDLWPLMTKQAEQGMIANDGLHPSAPCYEAWSEALIQVVRTPGKP